jgi:hypothetical protein
MALEMTLFLNLDTELPYPYDYDLVVKRGGEYVMTISDAAKSVRQLKKQVAGYVAEYAQGLGG